MILRDVVFIAFTGLLCADQSAFAKAPTVRESLDRMCALYTRGMKDHAGSILVAHRAIDEESKAILEPILRLLPKDGTSGHVAPAEIERAKAAVAAKGWHLRIVEAWIAFIVGDPSSQEWLWSSLARDEKIEDWHCAAMKAHDEAIKAVRKSGAVKE
jgi:hypothetical protein